jgi:hypothetical protein
MFNHPYICLSTHNDLDDPSIKSWIQAVTESGPSGIVSAVELHPNKKPQKFYKRKLDSVNHYCAALSRNLEGDEANKIAHAYGHLVPDGDFEISYSQTPQTTANYQPVTEDILKSIALSAAKRNHSNWLNQKINEGWRYGLSYNTKSKTSPMCREWDALAEQYKKAEYHRIINLLEVLDEMNLSLVAKKC